MAKLGDRIVYKTGEAIVVRWRVRVAGELQTGLAGTTTVTVYDEADVSFTTPSVTEPITGVYQASFTPDAAGTWTVTIVESSVPAEEIRVYEVAAAVIGDRLPDTLSLASIQTEAEQALETYRLDELVAVAAGSNPVISSFLDRILNKNGSQTFNQADDSLEAIRDRGDAAWDTATGFAVPGDQMNLVDGAITAAKFAADAITSAVLATDAIGAAELAADAVTEIRDAITAVINDLTAQEVRDAMKLAPTAGTPAAGSVDEHLDTIEGRVDVATSTRSAPGDAMDLVAGAVDAAALAADAVGEIADGVWDEPLVGHVAGGSTGENQNLIDDIDAVVASNLDVAVSSRAVAGDAMALTGTERAAVVDAVLDELLSGHTTPGSLGQAVSDILADTADAQPRVVLIQKLLKNRFEISTVTGVATLYDDDGTTPLLTAQLYLDASGATDYDGTAAIHRRDALS